MTVAPELAAIVQPASAVLTSLRVVTHEPRLDQPLADAAARMRAAPDAADITAAVRTMYKGVGIDPTKTRPSAEALLRRVKKGDPLPRINSLVDVINWCSLESQLPFGLYDARHIRGAVVLRLGAPGEAYPGIRKDAVHLEGRLVLADDEGAFGNPTSDSLRAMVTESTTDALVVIFAPRLVAADAVTAALAMTVERAAQYCG